MSFMASSGGAALGAAFVAVRPDMSSFSSDVEDGIRPGLRGAAERIKESMKSAGEEGGSALSAGFGAAAQEIQRHAVVVGAAFSAAGLGLETWARSQQDANVSLGRLSTATGIAEGDLRSLVGELDNVTFSTDEVVAVLGNASAQGIRSAEDMAHFARTWDLVADATGESVVALSDAGVALRALDITDPADALDAFGFITTETTGSVEEFLQFVERTGPELRKLGLDVDDTAAIMGVLERELGLTGRTARTQFRQAVADADGDLGKMLETLGVSPAAFAAMRAEVEGSGEAIERNAQIYADSFTPLQRLQSFVGETMFQFGGLANAAGIAGGALTAMGPAIMAVSQAGPAMAALGAGLGRVRAAVQALTVAMAKNPLGLLAVGVGTAVAALGVFGRGSDDTAEKVDNLARAMRDAGDAATGIRNMLFDLAAENSQLSAAMVEAGVSLDDLTTAAQTSDEAVGALVQRIYDAALEMGVGQVEAGQLALQFEGLATNAANAALDVENLGVLAAESEPERRALAAAHAENSAAMREALTATEDLTAAFDEQAVQAAASEAAAAVMTEAFDSIEAAADALRDRVDSAMQAGARAINKFSEDGKSSLSNFVTELTSNIGSLTEWQDNLVTIAERGSADFALAMGELGPEFSGVVAELANATDTEFAEAMAAMTSMTEATQRDMATEFGKVDDEFGKTLAGVAGLTERELQAIKHQAAVEAFNVGFAMGDGMERGVNLTAGRVAAAAAKVVTDAMAAARRAGEISSPSKLFAREIGAPLAQGVALGIEGESRHVSDAIAGLIATPDQFRLGVGIDMAGGPMAPAPAPGGGNEFGASPASASPQMDPIEWGQMAARAYASTLRQLQRAG